jgi:hypothetical protein
MKAGDSPISGLESVLRPSRARKYANYWLFSPDSSITGQSGGVEPADGLR